VRATHSSSNASTKHIADAKPKSAHNEICDLCDEIFNAR
jgi:hypothetical protein